MRGSTLGTLLSGHGSDVGVVRPTIFQIDDFERGFGDNSSISPANRVTREMVMMQEQHRQELQVPNSFPWQTYPILHRSHLLSVR